MWLLDRMLSRLVTAGQLIVTDADGSCRTYGNRDPERSPVAIRFTDGKVGDFIARHPRLGAAEAFMDGRLVIDEGDILQLIDLIRSNGAWERGGTGIEEPGLFRRMAGTLFRRLDRINWAAKSKRNVAHHYDLGDHLYDLFLDADRQYSCAYFTEVDTSLEQAQSNKKAHIAAKLALKPGQRVLDIGCGWGGLALYLHRAAGVDVLGITLSEEQLRTARRRAEEAGVADHVKFELIDYRAMTGVFDRIVSVGMFEHVGPPSYRKFFANCRSLLAEDGVMLLHTIGRMGEPGTTDAFTAKYIFPGGYNPALSEIIAASEKTKLIASDIETLRLHYARTIRHWYQRTVQAKDQIVALYDERLYCMWTFYLAGALTAFTHGSLVNYQIQYIRHRSTLPITRDYIGDAEAQLKCTRFSGGRLL